MKPSYQGFEAKKSSGFVELPAPGAYLAEIREVRLVPADGDKRQRDVIEMMLDITDGEYKGRYMEVYNDQKERFSEAKYKGIFRLSAPKGPDDEDWVRRNFEGNLWAVEQSNPDYAWDWDEKKLKGKKVGISVRKYLYTYNDKDRESTEIGRLESIPEIKAGKVKEMKPRDRRQKDEGNSEQPTFTDVSDSSDVCVPW